MKKLSEFATLRSGLVCKSKDYTDRGVLLLRATNIATDHTISVKEKIFLSPEIVKEKHLLQKGDILLTKVGSRIGDCAIFREDFPAVANGNLIVISPNSIDPEKLLKRIIQRKDEINELASGFAMQSINLSGLSELMV